MADSHRDVPDHILPDKYETGRLRALEKEAQRLTETKGNTIAAGDGEAVHEEVIGNVMLRVLPNDALGVLRISAGGFPTMGYYLCIRGPVPEIEKVLHACQEALRVFQRKAIIHLAARPKGLIQRCSKCGCILTDYRGAQSVGDTWNPSWWNGAVEVSGEFPATYRTTTKQPNCYDHHTQA